MTFQWVITRLAAQSFSGRLPWHSGPGLFPPDCERPERLSTVSCCWRWCWWGEWKKDTCATLTPVRALVSKKAMECSRAKASPRSLSTCTNMITKVEMTIATSLLPSRSALLPRRIKGTPGKPNSSMLPSHLPIPEKLTDMHVTNKLTNDITCWTG